jgi:hypothetical protein
VTPYYHGFMHAAEIPITAARKITVPLLHEGTYRRRLLCFTMPGCVTLMTVIINTHLLKGSHTSSGAMPNWVIGFILGSAIGIALHFYLPKKETYGGDEAASRSLLAGQPVKPQTTEITDKPGESHAAHGHHRPWYKKIGIMLAGPNDQPQPKGPVFGFLLTLSFIMSLFWLLLIADEIVGTVIFMGKVSGVPQVVLGLTVLAVG